eukprot:CAMPEP_0171327740 /NCGR_PEP_ID=MMETSP0878-20121228/215_1 /TAXON_ID=67004 /ORGANISM="Thalassiosira weissflogii, Strain CCMP1336" /LENGTH=390 /DNA_ID=CAMNT_0011827537 /DNA_START=32 /DNA_END=1204 /DNA_ORIENTATION=-
MTCLEFSAVLVNAGTFIALTVLLIWSTVHLFGGDGNEDGGNRWVNEEGQWDFELGPDGSDSIKVLYDLVVLIIASGAMFGPLCKGWDLGNGVYHKVNVGIIAGSTYMFSNMLLVSFWYMFDFDQRDNANMNYNNNYNYQNWEMDEKERLMYHRSVISFVSLAFGIVMMVMALLISKEGVNLPEIDSSLINAASPAREIRHAEEMEVARLAGNAAHLDMLSNSWHLLNAATMTVFGSLQIATFFALGGEEAERMIEEGQIYNLVAVTFWLLVVTGGISLTGHQTLGGNKWGGSMGAGALTGVTMCYALLLFMVSLLYSGSVFVERERNDAPATSIALSIACFFLSIFYLAFAKGTIKYRSSITGAIPVQVEAVDDVGHDFVRVDGPGVELA